MVNFCCAILDAKAGQEREGHRFFRWIGTDVRSGLLLLELGAKEAYYNRICEKHFVSGMIYEE